MKYPSIITALLLATTLLSNAQGKMKPADTEVWEPLPKVVEPATATSASSDAIVLFDGKSLDQWVQADDKSPAKWAVSNNELTVNKQYGNIKTKGSFTNYQLHLDWKVPTNITGGGQLRGNSGLYENL